MSPTTAPVITSIVGQLKKWCPATLHSKNGGSEFDFGFTNVAIGRRIRVWSLPADAVDRVSPNQFRATENGLDVLGTIHEAIDTHRVKSTLDGHAFLPQALLSSTGWLQLNAHSFNVNVDSGLE
jgi:hypothetical protein